MHNVQLLYIITEVLQVFEKKILELLYILTGVLQVLENKKLKEFISKIIYEKKTLNIKWSSSSTVEPGKRGRPEDIS